MHKILLFIPAYNCEKQITRVLDQLDAEILSFISQVIIVNNISSDNTEEVIIKYLESNPTLPILLLRNYENYNLGGSHKVAFEYALNKGFDYIIVLHGDDQGRIKDFLPILQDNTYTKYDCCLGARFMKDSEIEGYSKIRIFGNYIFNTLFSIVTGRKVYDLGSGLNLYSTDMLQDRFYYKFPDELFFNNCMILASAYYDHNVKFIPISWRETDQISNNKLAKFSINLLKMSGLYVANKKRYMSKELRKTERRDYLYQIIYQNNLEDKKC